VNLSGNRDQCDATMKQRAS